MECEDKIIESNWDESIENFDDMGLNGNLLSGIYSYGYQKPQAIQQKGIRPIILGHDTIAQASSGTGKTATFTIGMLQIIDNSINQCQGLILVPTRDLAFQIHSVISQIGEYMHLKCHVCIGGTNLRQDKKTLNKGVHVVVGTPGRVFDMMRRNHINPQSLRILVLDEADEMLSGGFKDQIQKIFNLLPGNIQYCLFSTNFPPEILRITKEFMREPVRILVKKDELTLEGIKQYYVPLQSEQSKISALCDLFENLGIFPAIIYCNTRKNVENLSLQMANNNHLVSFMHGRMEHSQKELIMREFRNGNSRVLVTTDMLTRGIDVQFVSLVINFDIPTSFQNYQHRIRKRGSIERKEVIINFVTPNDAQFLGELEMHYSIQIEEIPADFGGLLL